jgi:peroxiredoxin
VAASAGEQVSDFELPASSGGKIRLGSHLGHGSVLVVFYSSSFDDVCRDDLRRLQDDLGRLASAGVHVLTVSCDSAPVQWAWAKAEGFSFPLLSDFWPHGEVARAYDAFDLERGSARHVMVAIEPTGRVAGTLESDPKSPRPSSHLDRMLALLAPPAEPAAEPEPPPVPAVTPAPATAVTEPAADPPAPHEAEPEAEPEPPERISADSPDERPS